MAEETKNEYPTMRSVMQKSLGCLAVATVGTILVIVIIAIVVSAELTRSIADSALIEQADRHVRGASVELSLSVEEQLHTVESSAVLFVAGMLGQALSGSANPMSPFHADSDPFHTDVSNPEPLPRTPEQEGIPDGSVWNTAGVSSSTPTLTGETESTRVETTIMDAFMGRVYDSIPAVIAVYAGFETEGFFRIYPGIAVTSDTAYDPRQRGWYSAALNKADSLSSAATGAYWDYFGNGWLLSLSAPIVLPSWAQSSYQSAGSTVGVASCDIPVTYLRESVLNVTFFDRPAAQLATLDGGVVASPFWDTSDDDFGSTDPPPPKLWELDGSGISEDFWDSTLSANVDDGAIVVEATADDGIQRLYARSFVPVHPCDRPGADKDTCGSEAFDPQFVIVVAARSDDVRESLTAMAESIAASEGITLAIAIGCSIVTLIVVVFVLQWLVAGITQPLQRVVEAAKDITKQSSGDEVHGEVDVSTDDLPDDEVGVFVKNFHAMVQGINKKTASVVTHPAKLIANPFADRRPWDDSFERMGVRHRRGASGSAGAPHPSAPTYPSASHSGGGGGGASGKMSEGAAL